MKKPHRRPGRRLAALHAAAVMAISLVAGVIVAPPVHSVQNPYERGPAPTEASVRASRGPFSFTQVSVPGTGTGFGSGTIYYPNDTSQGTFGAVAVSPGYLSPEFIISWLGPKLASNGFVVITFSASAPGDQPDSRGRQLLAALDHLTTRSPAAVRQRIDPSRLAVMGHSMGGGGALRAANDRPALQAAVTMGAWHTTTDWSGVRVPTMVMGAENDFIAPNDRHSLRFFTNMPNAPEKAYLRVTGTGHVNIGMETPVGGKFSLSWLKRFVDDDIRYDQFVCPTPSGGVVEYRSTCPHT